MVRVNAVHKCVDEPGHRSCSKEKESRVGTNVSELLGGEVGISMLMLVMAAAAGLSSHRRSANAEQNLSGNILARGTSSSDGGGV